MNDIHNYIYWEDDAPEIDVPEDFFSKRWPHPRRRNNAPPRARAVNFFNGKVDHLQGMYIKEVK